MSLSTELSLTYACLCKMIIIEHSDITDGMIRKGLISHSTHYTGHFGDHFTSQMMQQNSNLSMPKFYNTINSQIMY